MKSNFYQNWFDERWPLWEAHVLKSLSRLVRTEIVEAEAVGRASCYIAHLHGDDLVDRVREQCRDWFGADVERWEHLKTMSIAHALPDQRPPTSNPYEMPPPYSENILICGEHQSLPGLLWALMSGEMAGRRLVGSRA